VRHDFMILVIGRSSKPFSRQEIKLMVGLQTNPMLSGVLCIVQFIMERLFLYVWASK